MRLRQKLHALKKDGIDCELFESVRRSMYGKEIMMYNDIDSVANSMITCDFNGWNMFDAMDIYKNVTVSDLEKRLSNMMFEQYSALSVVKNKD